MSSKKKQEAQKKNQSKFGTVVRATVDSLLYNKNRERASHTGSIIQPKSNRNSAMTHRNSLVSKPFQMPIHVDYSDRSASECQRSLLSELQQKIILISSGTEIMLSDKGLSRQEYYKKYQYYVILVQSRSRGNRTRKRCMKTLKNYRHRLNVINELITTEEGYVNDLDLVLNYIRVKMLDSGVISKKEVDIILSKYSNIWRLNNELLSQLKQQDKTKLKYLYDVGNVLNTISVYFKIYFDFYNDQPKSQALFKELRQSNHDFAELLKTFKKDPKLRGLGCEGFMIKPVQRLPKYELLLNDFLKHTENDHPLKPIYQESLSKFKQVCQQNDANMKKYIQEIKLFDLQKNYGEGNSLEIITNARAFVSEDRMTIVQDSLDKSVLVYFLSDMILICEKDEKAESGYKYFKHVILTDKSHVQSIPNKRFFMNLTKVIGKNQMVTFMSESQEIKEKLMHDINTIIHNQKDRHSSKISQSSNYQSDIAVQIKGTQEREANTFSAYTVYIIEISINQIISQVFLRFSEIKCVDDIIQKEHPDIRVPHLASTLFGNKEYRTIENRKLQIEDFLLSLLINEDFQTKNEQFQNKILKMLRLDPNFYKFPELLELIQRTQQDGPKGSVDIEQLIKKANKMDEKIQAGQLLRASIAIYNTSDSQSLGQPIMQFTETLTVPILFFDETKLEIQISEWFRGSDLIKLISEKINLQETCDFRLFETDDTLAYMRLILEEELISPIFSKEDKSPNRLSSFFGNKRRKCLILKKYLYLPKLFEETQEQLQVDATRSRLLTMQIYYELKQLQYQFNAKDFSVFAALYLIITKQMQNNSFSYDILHKIVPVNILKQQSKAAWINNIAVIYRQLEQNITQFLHYKLTITDFDLHNKIQFDHQYIESIMEDIAMIPNTSIRAGQVLQEIIAQHPLYGMNLFQVQIAKNELNGVIELIHKKIFSLNYYLGISNKGVHLLDENKRQELYFIRFMEIDYILVFAESLAVVPEGKKQIQFQTTEGFEIKSLVDDYEYLEEELQKIRSSQSE